MENEKIVLDLNICEKSKQLEQLLTRPVPPVFKLDAPVVMAFERHPKLFLPRYDVRCVSRVEVAPDEIRVFSHEKLLYGDVAVNPVKVAVATIAASISGICREDAGGFCSAVRRIGKVELPHVELLNPEVVYGQFDCVVEYVTYEFYYALYRAVAGPVAKIGIYSHFFEEWP